MSFAYAAVAIGGAALVGAAASTYAAKTQANAAKKAAKTQANAAEQQTGMQRQIYEQTRADQAPWRGAGELGLSALSYGLGLSPTGYLPGMSKEVQSMTGQAAQQYDTAASSLTGGDQWEVVTPPGYRRNMVVKNTATGETKEVPLTTERNALSLRRYLSTQASASGWGVQGETVPQAGSIISGPMSQPTAEQIAKSRAQMNALSAPAPAASASVRDPYYAGATGLQSGQLLRRFGASDFQADPGYAFRQSEGMKGIEHGAAARGGLLSGSALKATQRFGQDLASQEYQNAYNRYSNDQSNVFNRLASMAGIGQTANAALGNAGQNYANAATGISQANAANQGNAILAAGGARSSGYLGAANAAGNAFANFPRQQAGTGYQIPQGYQLGTGALGNTAAMNQGYQPLDYGTYNSMGGYYD